MEDLDKFVGVYPDQEDPLVAVKVALKKEFYDVRAQPTEPLHKSYTPLLHQENFVRLVTSGIVDRILVMDEAGTGKTCKISYVAERFKKLREIGDLGGKIRKCYILVPSDVLKDEFSNQIVCSCTTGEYDISDKSTATTAKGRRAVITHNLKSFYRVVTYGSFVNEIVKDLKGEEDIKRKFRNVMIYCDEAHNLNVIKSDTGIQRIHVVDRVFKSFSDFINERDQIKKEHSEKKTKDPDVILVAGVKGNAKIYSFLWLLFHSMVNSVVILGSATPAINSINEMIPLYNLILPEYRQIPSETNFMIDNFDDEAHIREVMARMAYHFQGYTSFTRALDTGIEVVEQGVEIDVADSRLRSEYGITSTERKIYGYRLNPFHSMVYNVIQQESGNFETNKRHASIGIFPDQHSYLNNRMWGTIGGMPDRLVPRDRSGVKKRTSDTFSRWITTETKNTYIPTAEFIQVMTSPVPEEVYSAVPGYSKSDWMDYWKSVGVERPLGVDLYFGPLAHKYRVTFGIPGGGFSYHEYAFGSGGAIVASVILSLMTFYKDGQEVKFERYSPSPADFASARVRSKGGLCNTGTTSKKILIPKKFRYALITNETPKREIEQILELRNHPDNVNGEYLYYIIGSPISRDGININHAGFVGLHPTWNESARYQAMFRCIRTKSHVERIRVDKEALRERGAPEVDIQMYRPVIKVFNFGSTLYNSSPTIDIKQYLVAEKKNKNIRLGMKVAKMTSIDSFLNLNRNVRPGDPESLVYYPSYAVKDEHDRYHLIPYDASVLGLDTNTELTKYFGTDTTTYDIYYKDQELATIFSKLKLIFKKQQQVSISELCDRLNEHRVNLIIACVYDTIINYKTITDRYGFAHYLVLIGSVLALVKEYPEHPFEYTGDLELGLVATVNLSLNTVAAKITALTGEAKITEAAKLQIFKPEDVATLDKESMAKMLEDVIIQKYEGKKSQYITDVLNYFSIYHHEIPYPRRLITMIREKIVQQTTKKGPGAPVKNVAQFKKGAFNYVESPQERHVIYHILLLKPNTETGYADITWIRTPADGDIRYFDTQSRTWRTAENAEQLAFKTHHYDWYDRQDKERRSKFTMAGIYDQNKRKFFVARYYLNPVNSNANNSYKGRECRHMSTDDIALMMAKGRIEPSIELTRGVINDARLVDGKVMSAGLETQIRTTTHLDVKKNSGYVVVPLDPDEARIYVVWSKLIGNVINKDDSCDFLRAEMLRRPHDPHFDYVTQ